MDEFMVEQWNKTVKAKDTVYHLGDVVINRKSLPIMDRLNGRKVLVKGNHDIFKLKDYAQYFDDIRAYKVMTEHKIICSHIPIHKESLERWDLNVHGHLHSNRVMKDEINSSASSRGFYWEPKRVIDERYLSVCVEQIHYTPLSLEEILAYKETL